MDWDLSREKGVREQMLGEFATYKDDDTEGTLRPQKVLWDGARGHGSVRHFAVRCRGA